MPRWPCIGSAWAPASARACWRLSARATAVRVSVEAIGPRAVSITSFGSIRSATRSAKLLAMSSRGPMVSIQAPSSSAKPFGEAAAISAFDGQDVLESGLAKPGATDSGWLNRALSSLAADGRVDPQGSRAFAVGPVTPLVVRGTAPIMSWSPHRLLPASDDTQMRLLDLYRHTDAKLARAFEGRRDLATLARTGGIETIPLREGEAGPPGIGRIREYVGNVASAAAKCLAQPNGPRVGAASFVGWDTHQRSAASGQLAALLGTLDEAIAAIEKTMADAWSETVIAIVTEFGRTARINGTDGTDHGTATVAVLAGGALKGGRVIADWPGLTPADLHEGRDLKPTIDLRAVLKGVLRDHLRVDKVALATSVFPGSDDAKPMAGLLA
jgi:uncharacterized protein (DUF1501 family)